MSIQSQINRKLAKINKALLVQANKKSIKVLAGLVVNIVKERTRRGFGVKPSAQDVGGRTFKFPALSDSYIQHRIRNSRRLSRFANISSPNNTFTGKMLSDLRVTGVSNSGFSVGFRSKKSREKADFLENMGREFMHLSKKEISILVKAYENILSRTRI